MADSVRVRRVAEQIRGELSEILRDEVRDPRLGMVTVTRVKLAADLGAATIFYSPLGEDPDEARQQQLEQLMGRLSGFVRRALSRRVKLRHTPELRFVLDDSIAAGSQTLDLIRSLDIPPDADADADAGADANTEAGADAGEAASEEEDDGPTQPAP